MRYSPGFGSLTITNESLFTEINSHLLQSDTCGDLIQFNSYTIYFMQIEYITSDVEFQGLASEWNDLLRNSQANSIFLTWEWLFCWWEIYKDDCKNLLLVRVRGEEGETLCLVPLMMEESRLLNLLPVFKIRFLGTGEKEQDEICTEYLDFIVAKKADTSAIVSFVFDNLIKDNENIDYLLFEKMSETSLLSENIDKAPIKGFDKNVKITGRSHYIKLENDWDLFMAGLSSSQRYRVKRTLKEFRKQGEVEFKIVSDRNQLQDTFNHLARLHQKRWTARGQDGLFSSSYFCNFHIKLMNLLLENGNLMLAELIVNNKICAVIYNLNYDGVISYYQSGIDTDLENSKLRPGLAIHTLAIEAALKTGATEYDFLLGDSDYKRQWSKTTKTIYTIKLTRRSLQENLFRNFIAIRNSISKLLINSRIGF